MIITVKPVCFASEFTNTQLAR